MYTLLWVWVAAGWSVWRYTAALELQEAREGELGANQTPPQTPAHITSGLPSTTQPVHGQSHTCPQQPAAGDLRVTKVTREEAETTYQLTVCYVAPEKPKVFQRYTMVEKSKAVQHDFGVVTLHTHKPSADESLSVLIEFYTKYKSVTIEVSLKKNLTKEMNIPNIYMESEARNEIVYRPGSSVDIKFNVIDEANEMKKRTYDWIDLYQKSIWQDDTVDLYPVRISDDKTRPLSEIQYTETKHSEENKTLFLHMPYAPERERGLVLFKMITYIDLCQGCLLKKYFQKYFFFFYPTGLEAPFPENFVGFVNQVGLRADFEENEKVRCTEDAEYSNCLLYCWVLGDDPSVNITKADGSLTSAHSMNAYLGANYFAYAGWRFDNPQLGDEGDYLCQAKSRDGSAVITRTITLSVGKDAKIVRSLTRVITFRNGSVSAVCTAQGRPAPTVRFGPYYEGDPTTVIDEADVTMTQLDNSTSQATLFIASWRKYDRYAIHNIYCIARNGKYRDDRQHIVVDEDVDA